MLRRTFDGALERDHRPRDLAARPVRRAAELVIEGRITAMPASPASETTPPAAQTSRQGAPPDEQQRAGEKYGRHKARNGWIACWAEGASIGLRSTRRDSNRLGLREPHAADPEEPGLIGFCRLLATACQVGLMPKSTASADRAGAAPGLTRGGAGAGAGAGADAGTGAERGRMPVRARVRKSASDGSRRKHGTGAGKGTEVDAGAGKGTEVGPGTGRKSARAPARGGKSARARARM